MRDFRVARYLISSFVFFFSAAPKPDKDDDEDGAGDRAFGQKGNFREGTPSSQGCDYEQKGAEACSEGRGTREGEVREGRGH